MPYSPIVDRLSLSEWEQKTRRGFIEAGEPVTMKEECRDVVDKVIQYSQEKKYISEVKSCDIDSIADEIVRQ